MSDAPRILVVDDEPDLARTILHALRNAGLEASHAATGKAALEMAGRVRPDVILLDLMLPDMSGNDVLRTLRGNMSLRSVPVIVVSARGEEIDRVVTFELGADDYVTKPFSLRELTLRVLARVRREPPAVVTPEGRTRFGVLEIDHEAHRCFVGGEEIHLTVTEFRLLHTLFDRRNRTQVRQSLVDEVWQGRIPDASRTLDTHVRRLREKLGRAGGYIHTVRGVGYRFASSPSDVATTEG